VEYSINYKNIRISYNGKDNWKLEYIIDDTVEFTQTFNKDLLNKMDFTKFSSTLKQHLNFDDYKSSYIIFNLSINALKKTCNVDPP